MKKYLTPILTALIGMTCSFQAASVEYVTQTIMTHNNNSSWLQDVDAYGSTVAWRHWDPYNSTTTLYYWDGETIEVISSPGESINHLSLYNGKIAYTTNNNGVHRVKYWDGTYDASSQPIVVEIANGVGMNYVSLYSGRIAWHASDGNDSEIFYWDGTYTGGQPNITQITDNDEFDQAPDLDDNLLAWYGGPNGSSLELRYWDGISINSLNSSVQGGTDTVSASDGGIAWKSRDGYIYYWDGTYTGGNPDIVRVTDTTVSGRPSLYNGKIAYTSGKYVYYWDGTTTSTISDQFDTYIDGAFTPSLSSGGVAYSWRNLYQATHEIRFVTFPTQCP